MKENRYGYQTGNCIPCQNKSSGSKHIDKMRKQVMRKAVILERSLIFFQKKNKQNANNAKLEINKFG